MIDVLTSWPSWPSWTTSHNASRGRRQTLLVDVDYGRKATSHKRLIQQSGDAGEAAAFVLATSQPQAHRLPLTVSEDRKHIVYLVILDLDFDPRSSSRRACWTVGNPDGCQHFNRRPVNDVLAVSGKRCPCGRQLLSISWLTVEAGVRSAPPECCNAGADGQPSPCRSARLLEFNCRTREPLVTPPRGCSSWA